MEEDIGSPAVSSTLAACVVKPAAIGIACLLFGPIFIGLCANDYVDGKECIKFADEHAQASAGASLGPDSTRDASLINCDYGEVHPSISSYSMFRVDPVEIASKANDEGFISIPIGDSFVTLVLRPSLVQPMTLEEIRAPSPLHGLVSCIHFSGYVEGHADSTARVTFDVFGITSWLKLGEEEYFIEPLRVYDDNAENGLQIVYSNSNLRRNFDGFEDAAIASPTGAVEVVSGEPDGTGEEERPYAARTPVVEADNGLYDNSSISPESEIEQQVPGDVVLSSAGQTPIYRIMRLLAVTDITFREEMGRFCYRYPPTWVNMINGWYEQVGVQIEIVATYNWMYDNSDVDDMVEMRDILRHEIRYHTSYTDYDQCNLFTGGLSLPNKGFSPIRGAGTGLFGDASKTTHGFSITVMNWEYAYPEHEEILAHELGHALNGVHDQTDPMFKVGGSPPPESTLMGYSETYWHWFSDGSHTLLHMNSQRIKYWAEMNLHTILWYQSGGVYSNYPSDNIVMTDLAVKVRDLPGPTDRLLHVQFYLMYLGPAQQIALNYVNTHLTHPSGGASSHDYIYNVVLKKNREYRYETGPIMRDLTDTGIWTVTAAYYYNGHIARYTTCSIDVSRFNIIAETAVVQTGYGSSEWAVDIEGLSNYYTSLPVRSWNFKLLCYNTQPRVGDRIYVYWGAFNADDDIFYHPEQFKTYVACQRPDLIWDDFGHKYHTCWAHTSAWDSYGGGGWNDLNWLDEWNPGGGYCTFLASNYLSMSGIYRIIPDMYVDGTYSPWYDATVYLSVTY